MNHRLGDMQQVPTNKQNTKTNKSSLCSKHYKTTSSKKIIKVFYFRCLICPLFLAKGNLNTL